MKYGYFDDALREYVITTPRTPLPWINYLGCEDFFTLVSNTAGGYCFYRDARLRRLTRYRYNNSPLDSEGFRVYLRDGNSVWNPGWQPVQAEPDSYCCRQGLGYTVIEAEKDSIAVRQEMLVPRGDNCLLIRLTLCNNSAEPRKLQVFPYLEFCLWDANDDGTNFQRNYSIGEVEIAPNAVYHKTEYRERRNHYAVFWSDRPADGFDTSREAFLGVYGSPAHPAAVFGEGCTGSVAHGWQPVAAQQFNLDLAPGESTSLLFGLGYLELPASEKWASPGCINRTPAEAMMARYNAPGAFDSALQTLREYWEGLLSGFRVSTGSEKLNRMVNVWNQYQCMVTFNMSRSASYFESGMGRGMGFRDSCQDLLGFVHMIPERARERILDIAATQFPDGSAYHQYQPLTKKGNLGVGSGFNDDPLWLIAGTDAYLRETGDWSILKEPCAFDSDPSTAQPLMEHLRRSFRYTVTHLGPHNLPLIGPAKARSPKAFSLPACLSNTAAPMLKSAVTWGWNRKPETVRLPLQPWKPPFWMPAGTAPGSAGPMIPSAMSSAGVNARKAKSSLNPRACVSWRASVKRAARPPSPFRAYRNTWKPRTASWYCSPPTPVIVWNWAKSAVILRATRKMPASSATATRGLSAPRRNSATANGLLKSTGVPRRHIWKISAMSTGPSPMSTAR